ncbi:hypothetical protein GCM10027027_17540 [Neomicrococcus lactis]
MIWAEDSMSQDSSLVLKDDSRLQASSLSQKYLSAAPLVWILSTLRDEGSLSSLHQSLPTQVPATGQQIDESEFNEIVEFLENEGLLRGTVRRADGTLMNPEITIQGKSALGSGKDPADHSRATSSSFVSNTNYGDSYSSTINGNQNGAVQLGRNNTMTYTAGSGGDEIELLRQTVSDFRQRLNQVELDDQLLSEQHQVLDFAQDCVDQGKANLAIRMLRSFTEQIPAALVSTFMTAAATSLGILGG